MRLRDLIDILIPKLWRNVPNYFSRVLPGNPSMPSPKIKIANRLLHFQLILLLLHFLYWLVLWLHKSLLTMKNPNNLLTFPVTHDGNFLQQQQQHSKCSFFLYFSLILCLTEAKRANHAVALQTFMYRVSNFPISCIEYQISQFLRSLEATCW